MLDNKLRHRRNWILFGVILFLLADLALNLFWMLNIPMGLAPDEDVRVILSDYIFTNGALPNAWDPAVRIHNWGFSYALRPLLVNQIGALNMYLVSLFTDSSFALLMSVRIISALSKTVMVYFCIQIGRWSGWKWRWTWLFAIVVSLTPQIAYLAGYHNNDIFAAACTTGIIYCWIRGKQTGWKWADCSRLAIALGLTMLSYYNAYPFILFSIPLFFMTIFKKGMTAHEKKRAWQKTSLIILVVFAISGWWFIRNLILYNGDLLGNRTRLEMGEQCARADLKPSLIFKPRREGISFFDLWNYNAGDWSWSQKTFMSSVALLGNMSILFPKFVYDVSAWIFTGGISLFLIEWIYSLIRLAAGKKEPEQNKSEVLVETMVLLSSLLVLFLSLYYSWSDDYQPQGRYIVPAFTGFVFLMVMGFRFLFQVLEKLPWGRAFWKKMSIGFVCLITAFMVGLQVFAIRRCARIFEGDFYLTPQYIRHRIKYGPYIDDEDVHERYPYIFRTEPSSKDPIDPSDLKYEREYLERQAESAQT